MAFFPHQANDAVRAALEMLQRLKDWNKERAQAGEAPVQIGIGLHTGSLMLGTVGARERMDTTVISDAVNLASRVENLTKTYRVPLIISEETYLALHASDTSAFRRIDRVPVQGKSQPVVLYEALEADEPDRRVAKRRASADFEAGLSCYDRLDFKAAIPHFERALVELPSDSVVQLLLERTRRFVEGGAVPTGGGAIRLEKAETP
jgi:Adenylate and Guanylate cyclase catalytic domain